MAALLIELLIWGGGGGLLLMQIWESKSRIASNTLYNVKILTKQAEWHQECTEL